MVVFWRTRWDLERLYRSASLNYTLVHFSPRVLSHIISQPPVLAPCDAAALYNTFCNFDQGQSTTKVQYFYLPPFQIISFVHTLTTHPAVKARFENLLIVGPKNVVRNWMNELHKVLAHLALSGFRVGGGGGGVGSSSYMLWLCVRVRRWE